MHLGIFIDNKVDTPIFSLQHSFEV